MEQVELQSAFHFELDDASKYGTTNDEYKLWVDYVFDYFHAGLNRPSRRILVSFGFSTLVWGICLIIATAFGFFSLYVESIGVYLFWLGIFWCFNALRWLSQTYHIRTNALRACFSDDDVTYKSLVSPFAVRATRNKAIFFYSFICLLPVYAYTWIVTFGIPVFDEHLLFVFPHALPPSWHMGAHLLGKMLVLDILWSVTMVHVYSGAQLTLATTPLYSSLATRLKVVPLPLLVAERSQGILRLYRTGSFMWSFGVVLAVFLYGAQLDIFSLSFVAAVLIFGLIALYVPRRAISALWQRSKEEALDDILSVYYADWPDIRPFDQTVHFNRYVDDILASDPARVDSTQILNVVGNILLPAVALAINSLRPAG